MNDYLVTGTRQQYWEEIFVKNVMEVGCPCNSDILREYVFIKVVVKGLVNYLHCHYFSLHLSLTLFLPLLK